LASLIKRHSADAQYIITTFKSELLDVSTNIIEVRFMNKLSKAIRGTVAKAKEIVSNISMNANYNPEE